MQTIKIKVTKPQITEIEVSLPYYFKVGNTLFYKAISETKAIEVITGGIFAKPSIMQVRAEFALNPENVISDEQEFECAWAKALIHLNQLHNKGRN